MATFAEYTNDLVAFAVTASTLAGYHVYLHHLSRRDAKSVLSNFAAEARSEWVKVIMSTQDSSILAIQTLRNSTVAATFLASTAVLLMVGVLTLSGQSVNLETTWHKLNFAGALQPEIWLAKILLMLVILFFAFFCFSNAIRIFTHVGYIINVRDPANGSNRYAPNLVASELNRGGKYFSLGTRAYYYLIPLVCWLFGPLYMVISTVILVIVLLPWVDRVPSSASI